jgi:hypothetical protein
MNSHPMPEVTPAQVAEAASYDPEHARWLAAEDARRAAEAEQRGAWNEARRTDAATGQLHPNSFTAGGQ